MSSRRVDLILTRWVSEGLLLKTRQRLSLADVSGCENPLNQQPASEFRLITRTLLLNHDKALVFRLKQFVFIICSEIQT